MEQSISDLFSDAFSETSVPSFPDGDLDFESLDFDEKFEEDKAGISQANLPIEEDISLHQEATGETSVSSSTETKDMNMAENGQEEQSDDDNDEEDVQGVSLTSRVRTPEEDYTSSDESSEQESSASGEEEEEEEEDEDEEEDIGTGGKPGDLLMSVCGSEEFCYGSKEDRIFAEGQPLAPEAAENPQVRNEDQGESESESESESDEEVSYFERVPERGHEMMVKGDGIKEDEQEREEENREDSSDSESEAMTVEQGENVLAPRLEQEVENPYRGGPAAASLEFPEISAQNLQDLIAEVDSEEHVEKTKDFSGEEHQEAGESFADYPSDFSSCEYVQGEAQSQESDARANALPRASDSSSNAGQDVPLEGAVRDISWTGREEDSDEEGGGYLYSRDLEMDADMFRGCGAAAGEKDRGRAGVVENVLGGAALTGCGDVGEKGESDSYSSSDDEVGVRRGEELFDDMCGRDLGNDRGPGDTRLCSGAAFPSRSIPDDRHNANNRVDPADFGIDCDFGASKTAPVLSEDTDKAETPFSDTSQRPAGNVNSYSAVQREDSKNTSPSHQGSLDDGFFFNTALEASGVTEQGQLGDDEYEDDRNWEQEQERIKAFYKFYDDSDAENEREERQIKVQFCTNPLSQVIHYETDSSDRDSLSSSTDREEDPSYADTPEEPREPDDTLQTMPACEPPDTQLPEKGLSNTQVCARKHTCLGALKLMLKMGLVIATGLLMFWLVTDQPEWLSQASFF